MMLPVSWKADFLCMLLPWEHGVCIVEYLQLLIKNAAEVRLWLRMTIYAACFLAALFL